MSVKGEQAHVLCINHAPEILDLLRTLLEEDGYRVSTLHTIDRSLETAASLAPDVITIDYMWASSDNEWTYLNMLTMDPRTRHIPVTLCTGAVQQAVAMESHVESIGVKVIFKPFDIDILLGAVRESLEPAQSVDPKIVAPDA